MKLVRFFSNHSGLAPDMIPSSCLVLLFLHFATSALAQHNPLQYNLLSRQKDQYVTTPYSYTTGTFLAQSGTEPGRINTPRILPGQSNLRINTGLGVTAPNLPRYGIPSVTPTPEPMKVNPLAAPVGNLTDQPPLPLRRIDESAFQVEPTVPIGSYYQPAVDYRSAIEGNFEPSHSENAAPLEFKPPTLRDSAPAIQTFSPDASQIDVILQHGLVLEKEGRWGEALAHYENAIRTYRKPPVLMQRFRFARFHHDLARRYNDSSFDLMLRQMSYPDALALFDEVVTKIQQSHVDPPHWNELFENGMNDFEIALADPLFCRRNLPNTDAIRVRSLSQKIVQTTQEWEIRDPRTLRAGVVAIADNCQKEIGLSSTAVVLEFLSGMTNSLDPYTEFMTLNQLNDTNCMISGNFVGLGVELKADRISLYINRVIPGSPAEKSGLKSFDRILAIDGTPTEGLLLEPASNLLQGKAETSVQLLIQSDSNVPREMLIKREHLKVPSVENVHILEEYGRGSGIGYFKLTGFQRDTTQEIHEALLLLYRQGMKSLIIDLRGNAGGVLDECIWAADLFLNQGIIVRTKNRGPIPERTYSTTRKSYTWDIPLAVLIDKDSASASEIFAGAILDNNRGLIVGQPSFGKDTVQAVIPLTGGKSLSGPAIAGLKLTTETYYSPNGTSFCGIGVQPNVPVSYPYQVSRPVGESSVNFLQPQSAAQGDLVLHTAIDELQRRSSQAQATQTPTFSSRYQPSVN